MAFSGSQTTRFSVPGWMGRPAGSFSGKSSAAATQIWPDMPEINAVRDRVLWVPFQNNTGQTLEIGDCLCWDINPDGRTEVAIPSASNLYLPAGIVFVRDTPDGLFGYLAVGGKPVNAKVLGAAGLTAGYPLTPVAGQVYLTKAAFSLEGGRFYPFVAAEAHTAVSTVLKRVLVRTQQ